jgi:hypothetical protein
MDPSIFFPVILLIAIVAAFAIVDRRSGGEPLDVASLFSRSWEMEWPRGVQEEEPVRFRVELLGKASPSEPSARTRPELQGQSTLRPTTRST